MIARGEALKIKQEDLTIHGHAIQLRVYAEDPTNNFLPSIGKLHTYRAPKGVGIRVDDGYEEGMDIPIYYDPMIAKLITYGKDRTEAIARMLRAIEEYEIDGPSTTLTFGTFAFQHEAFVSGNFDTHFVKKYFTADSIEKGSEDDAKLAAMIAVHLMEKRQKKASGVVLANDTSGQQPKSKWKDRAKL